MHLSIVKVILFCVYGSVLLCGSDGSTVRPKNVSVSAILVFGDSSVDQGNNNYYNTWGKANFLPYGEDFMAEIPTGRFTNGKTIPDLLGTFISLLRNLWYN
ncbi:putative cutinase [Helianthus anomalus]